MLRILIERHQKRVDATFVEKESGKEATGERKDRHWGEGAACFRCGKAGAKSRCSCCEVPF